jgi:AmmeMemoRadiSam system protein B
MSLNFAAISPHPPIIVPGIGTDEDLEKVGSTVLAMKKLATSFTAAEIDTLIVISPHALIYPDKFSICSMKKLFGTFASFGNPDIICEAQNDLDLLAEVKKETDKAQIETLLYDNEGEFFELDHGIMVPLQYLSKFQEYSFKLIPIAYSNLDRAAHFAFGQALKTACENYQGRVGILASGDMSHQLLQSDEGKSFDKKIVEDIKNNNTKEILYYEDDFVENAGECGYRSILILLGALDGTSAKPNVLSYEGPFGVGYMVANYTFGEK